MENRRLARYDYAKMNLTAAIKIEEIEKEISLSQQSLTNLIDKYEYKVMRLEAFVGTISEISTNASNRKVRLSKNEFGLE